jgi:hypothetical protein
MYHVFRVFLDHLADAAFLAIARRLAFESDFARAAPPLLAPSLLNATAWGLRVSFGGGLPGGRIGGPSPVAASTTAFAIWVKSRRLLARAGIAGLCHESPRASNFQEFKLHQYRNFGSGSV